MTHEEIEAERRSQWQAAVAALGEKPTAAQQVEALGFTSFERWTRPELPALAAMGAPAAALEEALASGEVVELRLWAQGPMYVTRELATFAVTCVGEQEPGSLLAAEVQELLERARGKVTVAELRQELGKARTSDVGVEHALATLAQRLLAFRVGRRQGEEQWQAAAFALGAQALEAARRGGPLHAAGALLSRWLDTMIADTEEEMAAVFRPLLSQQRVHTALAALQAARRVAPEAIDGRPAFRLPR